MTHTLDNFHAGILDLVSNIQSVLDWHEWVVGTVNNESGRCYFSRPVAQVTGSDDRRHLAPDT